MKLGIMQPYLLPYIGYWQLMNAVDVYVIYDDVNFIKGGWVNRNQLLLNGKPFLFTLPLIGMSPFKKINEIEISNQPEKFLKTVRQAYAKAPFFSHVYSLTEEIFSCRSKNLSDFLFHSITKIIQYLEINTRLVVSSQIEKNCNLSGQDKIIHICGLFGATEYYNAIGGRKLYSCAVFNEQNIKLYFLDVDKVVYQQYNNDFVPNLSILDVMMFNSPQEIKKLLGQFVLVQE